MNFQTRVRPWLLACFGATIASDKVERNHRFLEEALELVQACGCTKDDAHQLVDYVYGRPVGEPVQEVGGVMLTLAALCLAQALDMHEAGETELARVWGKVDQIRAKQAAKPRHGPLPLVTDAVSEDQPKGSAVNHPSHYNLHPSGIECIEVVEHMGFNVGNAVKYLWRADLKGNALEDLKKAGWYVQREIDKRDRGAGGTNG